MCGRQRSLRPHQCVPVLRKKQDLPDAHLHRCRRRNELQPLARLPLDRVDRIEADVEAHALRDQAFDLLAALAQAEGSGNPVARTYWRWSLTTKPFEIYKPASSAVGMYQITDGTYEIARRLCVLRSSWKFLLDRNSAWRSRTRSRSSVSRTLRSPRCPRLPLLLSMTKRPPKGNKDASCRDRPKRLF